MLKTFLENKILQADDAIADKRQRLTDAQRRKDQTARELEQSRMNPLERQLADEQFQVRQLERELSEAEIAGEVESRRDLVARYNTARAHLAEALIAAADANSIVEEIEAEAHQKYPRGTRPEAPGVFYQHSVSFPAVSIGKQGRIVAWLRDLANEEPGVLPEFIMQMISVTKGTEHANDQAIRKHGERIMREHVRRVEENAAKNPPAHDPIIADPITREPLAAENEKQKGKRWERHPASV